MVDTIAAVCIGISLAAACGFRVFVPMLIVGVAAQGELLTLADGFNWIGSWGAMVAFGVAAVLEIAGYYVPWLDNALDSAATPAAVIAGIILSAAFVHDMHPLLKWSLAIVAGGGAAGTVKASLVGLRLSSTAVTAGAANPLLSTVEWILATVLSLLSILLPFLAVVVTVVLVTLFIRFALARMSHRRQHQAEV